MQLFENISMAFASVRSNKMRSLLTMLGIIIGIAAVIAIVTVGNSMTGSVTDSMSGMGVSNITVTVKQKTSGDTQGTAQGVTLRRFMDETPGESDRITDAMIHDFYAAFPDKVDHFEYTVDVGQETISKYGDPTTTIKASVSGVNHDTLANKDDDSQILYGRWLDDAKDAGRMLACVSEKFVTQAIGGSPQDAIGKSFTLQGSDGTLYTYFIVGVYKYTEDSYSSMFGSTSDDDIQTDIYIPLDVARTITGIASGYQSFTVVAANGVDVTSFVNTVGDFFASYYTYNDSWTVSASSISNLVESMTEMLNTVSLGISAIAAISLLVGGIGVMNIMMVSVTERTREIGTRKALGAPAAAIRMQFITESVILCLIGGIAGILLGLALGAGLSKAVGYAARPSLTAIVVAVGFSMAIGVFFGYYPANTVCSFSVPFSALEFGGNVKVRDLAKRSDLGNFSDVFEQTLPAHSAMFLRMEGETRLEPTLYEAEWAYLPMFNDLGKNPKGIIYAADQEASGKMKVGFLGGQPENYAEWSEVYSADGGRYQMTVHYSFGKGRQLEIDVNGIVTKIDSLGEDDKHNQVTIPVDLKAGYNHIRMGNSYNWAPDIDCFTLTKGM